MELETTLPDSTPVQVLENQLDQFRRDFEALRREVGKVIVGHEEIVEGTLTALIAGGHVLLEGVPGLGKTLLVRTLADALHLEVPADPVHARPDAGRPDRHQRRARDRRRAAAGSSSSRARSSPTSSSPTRSTGPRPRRSRRLLEAMQEQSVTVAGKTHNLPAAVLRAGHAEPARDGGDVSAARGPARPLLLQAAGQVPRAPRRWRRSSTGRPRRTSRARPSSTAQRIVELSASWPGRSRSPTSCARYGIALVLATHPEIAQAHRDDPAVRPLRLQPARRAGDDPGGQDPGHPRPPLPRRPRRPPGRRPRRPAASPDPQLRRPGRGRPGRRHHRRHPGPRRARQPGSWQQVLQIEPAGPDETQVIP